MSYSYGSYATPQDGRHYEITKLMISPVADAKIRRAYHRKAGEREITFYGITHPHYPMYVVDVYIPKQYGSYTFTELDDTDFANIQFDLEHNQGLIPYQFNRVWIHTHPRGMDASSPSGTDWGTLWELYNNGKQNCMMVIFSEKDGYYCVFRQRIHAPNIETAIFTDIELSVVPYFGDDNLPPLNMREWDAKVDAAVATRAVTSSTVTYGRSSYTDANGNIRVYDPDTKTWKPQSEIDGQKKRTGDSGSGSDVKPNSSSEPNSGTSDTATSGSDLILPSTSNRVKATRIPATPDDGANENLHFIVAQCRERLATARSSGQAVLTNAELEAVAQALSSNLPQIRNWAASTYEELSFLEQQFVDAHQLRLSRQLKPSLPNPTPTTPTPNPDALFTEKDTDADRHVESSEGIRVV